MDLEQVTDFTSIDVARSSLPFPGTMHLNVRALKVQLKPVTLIPSSVSSPYRRHYACAITYYDSWQHRNMAEESR